MKAFNELRILRGAFVLAAVLGFVSVSPSANAAEALGQASPVRGSEVSVPLNKSHVLEFDAPIGEVSVGNPAIADVVPLTTRSVYILGKALGTTNLTVTGRNNDIVGIVDVTVTYDVGALRQRLDELAPGEQVTISPAADALILSGTVSSQVQMRRILAVAERFAPQKVTNLLSVGGSQQVLLNVRFAEVQRSAMKRVGANLDVAVKTGNDIYSLFSGLGIDPESFGTAAGSIIGSNGNVRVDAAIDALEQRGLVRTLAEPNVIALSGDTANLLAGGEFPIPVAQDTEGTSTKITVEFKQFGVGLGFTPTVVGRETINLVLNTEVSSIDETLRVNSAGISIPGLKVRRTNTTVELQDGQSFAISGLTQDNFADSINKFPVLADVPILGTLFRSPDFQRQQTELVVIVTAHLVRPVDGDRLARPTEQTVPPTDKQLFFQGLSEPPQAAAAPASDSTARGFVVP